MTNEDSSAAGDEFLRAMVTAMDIMTMRQNTGTEVTLTMPGLLVSGEIVPAWQWFQDNAFFKKLPPDANYLAVMADTELARARQFTEASADSVYIHMQNAQVLMGSQLVPTTSTHWWRGRLDQVTGWWFGTFVERAHRLAPIRQTASAEELETV